MAYLRLAAGLIGFFPAVALVAAEGNVSLPLGQIESTAGIQDTDAPPAACCTLPGRFAVAAAAANSTRVTIEPTETGQRVLIAGHLFAEYVADTGRLPAVWPIIGPSGHEMTRSWPLGPRKADEMVDHPHHESLWFSHGGVNGHDFWQGGKLEPPQRPHIVHTGYLRSEATDAGVAVIETTNDWRADGKTVLTDVRSLAFGLLEDAPDSPRYIDFTIRLQASEGPATFADTKEGTFGVRVPGAMKVDAQLDGEILSSSGLRDADAWGQPADWVDYHGPLARAEDEATEPPMGGITILSHPESFRPTCRWHVRTYGLFAANPFGAAHFPPGEPQQGAVTLAAGDSLTLRYRVIFYAQSASADTIRGWRQDFAATPLDQNTAPKAASR
ncbi:hypothetical protein Pla108_19650 [Botrimarina colliarenosi]|uniref:Methane oxygenase PmoA n=1 Tax=Botrimarina colliarenosi TaxID=2528001 RepID=A0A5C6AHW0_9BACT|nr:PmoA family protein [Botrimarina colliarenosi]TWT97813.1 hypothetical protein Pla108_19650 [Botrimarina colliarenosi]